jgi:hypothetical protein
MSAMRAERRLPAGSRGGLVASFRLGAGGTIAFARARTASKI